MRILIIGGGAAGFFGAITCAETFPQHEVILLEKSRSVLSKVRISGGGRCNVTHACFNNRQLAQHYPRGHKAMPSLLQQFNTRQTVQWFEERGVKLKTEADGRMFPSTDNSETIVECLQQAAIRARVQIRTSSGVKTITPMADNATGKPSNRFQVHLLDDSVLWADRILIATGGNPQLQSYEWIRQLANPGETLQINPPVPSLFTFNTPSSPLLELAGVSVPKAIVKVQGTSLVEEGPLLITHWGFSGPAILKLSAWGARELHEKNYRFTLFVNWLPGIHDETLRQTFESMKRSHPKKGVVGNSVAGTPVAGSLANDEELPRLPQRLWQKLALEAEIGEAVRWSELPKKNANKLIEGLLRSQFSVEGKSTFKEEFVTCGGISLSDIHLQTMESKRCPGLFFAGEVMDIDGVTGGFNFQSAWTTGYIAGKHMGLTGQ